MEQAEHRGPNDVATTNDCNKHAGQLVVKSTLCLANMLVEVGRTWQYFSCITKCFRLWRDHAKDVTEVWVDIHGAAYALFHAMILPRIAVAGRCGSTEFGELRLHQGGLLKVIKIFE